MFITFEGGEGAGKSTLIKKVKDALEERGNSVILTREPGGTVFGEELRHLVLEQRQDVRISAKAELFLFLAARVQHIEEVIRPAIASGKIVLCDRFCDSTIAYQGMGRGLGMEYVAKCCEMAVGSMVPDLTFYIDIDPKIGLARASCRAGFDRIEIEKIAFHQLVRDGFHQLAKQYPHRIVMLDGEKNATEVFEDAMSKIV